LQSRCKRDGSMSHALHLQQTRQSLNLGLSIKYGI